MEKEYIEKAKLYKEIAELEELARKSVLDTPTNSPDYSRYYAQLNERTALKHKIADYPAADVQEVKHGKWVDHNGKLVPFDKNNKGYVADSAVCSLCGERLSASGEYYVIGYYCPYCGAKMDGGESSTDD